MRSVKEWVGASDDSPVPPRVRLRVFDAKGGRCHSCKRKIAAGETWTCEHMKALINGGKNRESNLDITCGWCLPAKNAADVAEKSKTAERRKKHLGLKPPTRNPLPGGKRSRWKKRMDGTVVERTP